MMDVSKKEERLIMDTSITTQIGNCHTRMP
jgi:hypothetical protein